jgi:BirA family transcriptional regulator, biotin operon repressor / biotin---[acetyl-CoA-carboxylase] ligase
VSQSLFVPDGIEVIVLGEVGSTNDEVRRLADAGALGPLWVRATTQNKGRGRRGRSWLSAPGNLFMTGLLTLDVSPMEAANLSFLTALSVAQAIDHFVDPAHVHLKWPNDVLINGRKTSGILLESWTCDQGLQLAIGIGVNVVTMPEDVEQDITCVAQNAILLGNNCDAATLFTYILSAFHKWLVVWREQGFEPIASAWLQRAKGVGQPIIARLPHDTYEGKFRGLSRDGALELEMADGTIRLVTAGDVFFVS